MSKHTGIAWCDSTVNFWSGCTKVSPGCANCYAETLSERFQTSTTISPDGIPSFHGTLGHWGKGAPRQLHESAFKLAHSLNRLNQVCDDCGTSTGPDGDCQCGQIGATGRSHRRRIFSLSLGDWLDPEVPIEWLARMLESIRICNQVQWLLLTKRPELFAERLEKAQDHDFDHGKRKLSGWLRDWRLGTIRPEHVAIGTSVENQTTAGDRIRRLLDIPATKRFLSLEPLLENIDLSSPYGWLIQDTDEPNIHWVIVGGESGPKARPCNVDWIRSIVRQCKEAGVPAFVKQLGSAAFTLDHYQCENRNLSLKDRKGADPSQWPEDLRVQQHIQS